jgi:ABC-2 type transport system permease protein
VADLAIYTKLAGSRLRAQFSYRLSFVLQIVGAFFLSFLDFVAIVVIFQHLPRVAQWSLYEVAFLYGSSYVAFKAADVVMGNIDKLPTFIRMGSFDQILTRPIGTLGQVIFADLDIRHIGGITQGAIVLGIAVQRVGIAWSPGRIVVLGLMIVSAFVIYCSIWVATNAIAFWTMDAREVANAATYGGNFLTQFPMNVYGVWMRRLFGYVIPLAFVNYFPSLYILGKDDPTNAPHVLRFLSPVVALGSVAVAGAVWRLAVRRYQSTGS